METIRFETNIPQELVFNYATGKETEGRYGTQFFRGTVDGRAVYLPPIVEDRLIQLEVDRGERVSICKREKAEGRKKSIVWEVKRVDAPGEPDQPQQPVSRPAAADTTQPKPNGSQQAQTITNPEKPISQVSKCLAACGIAAIDAAILMEQYAQSKGYAMKLREDQIQALTCTLFIQNCKEGNIDRMHAHSTARANGGQDPWRQ